MTNTKQYLAELYSEALLEGIKIGVAGVADMLDGLCKQGVEVVATDELRSVVEQLRMRTALSIDSVAVAVEAMKRASES